MEQQPTGHGTLIYFNPQSSTEFFRVHEQLDWNVEFAGNFGYTWASIVKGSSDIAFSSKTPFSWHSHVDNFAYLSLIDCISLLLSEAKMHLLLTPNSITAFEIIPNPLLQIPHWWSTRDISGVYLYRLSMWCERTFGCGAHDIPTSSLYSYFGINPIHTEIL